MSEGLATEERNVANGRRDGVHYVIEGGAPLRGEVRLSGAKNAVTKCMVASMLSDDTSTIRNCPPKLGDVTITEEVMRALGSEVTWHDTAITTRTP